jgi:DNA-binding MarR family transcriptional regulator
MMKRIDAFYRSRLNGEIGAAQLTRLLLRIQHALLRNRMEVAKETGLSNGAMFTLFILRSYYPDDHITPKELGEATMMTSGGVTKVLHALADKGLVNRLQHPGDARSAMITLTEAGVQLVESILPIVEAKDRALLLDPLTTDDGIELTRLLRKLDAAVGDF